MCRGVDLVARQQHAVELEWTSIMEEEEEEEDGGCFGFSEAFKMEMMSVIFQLHSFSRLVLLSSCRSQLRL